MKLKSLDYFNSRPHEEVDKRWRGTETRTLISTHDLTRRSTRVAFRKNWKIKSFNSRPRKKVDDGALCDDRSTDTISTLDLTRRSTGNCGASSATGYISTLDLARRSTLAIVRDEQVCYYFNSRPRKEVDFVTSSLINSGIISTHDLARRSTFL